MSTLSSSLSPVHAKRLVFRTRPQELQDPIITAPADDGLGCMRGLAVAMLLNVVFALVIFGGWEFFRHLR